MSVGSKLVSGKLKVTTAGTRVQLSGAGVSGAALSVLIYASGTNEGEVVVGGETVVAKAGSHGTPERVGVGMKKESYLSFDINDPAQIWVDSTVSGDGIGYTVLYA